MNATAAPACNILTTTLSVYFRSRVMILNLLSRLVVLPMSIVTDTNGLAWLGLAWLEIQQNLSSLPLRLSYNTVMVLLNIFRDG